MMSNFLTSKNGGLIPFNVNGETQYFINNGKHIVYSEDGVYKNGCGIYSGNRPCKDLCTNNSDNCILQPIIKLFRFEIHKLSNNVL